MLRHKTHEHFYKILLIVWEWTLWAGWWCCGWSSTSSEGGVSRRTAGVDCIGVVKVSRRMRLNPHKSRAT